VVNTPSPESRPIHDAGLIRRAALAEGILCLTAIETAIAAAEGLHPDVVDRISEVRSLSAWTVLGSDRPYGVAAGGHQA